MNLDSGHSLMETIHLPPVGSTDVHDVPAWVVHVLCDFLPTMPAESEHGPWWIDGIHTEWHLFSALLDGTGLIIERHSAATFVKVTMPVTFTRKTLGNMLARHWQRVQRAWKVTKRTWGDLRTVPVVEYNLTSSVSEYGPWRLYANMAHYKFFLELQMSKPCQWPELVNDVMHGALFHWSPDAHKDHFQDFKPLYPYLKCLFHLHNVCKRDTPWKDFPMEIMALIIECLLPHVMRQYLHIHYC